MQSPSPKVTLQMQANTPITLQLCNPQHTLQWLEQKFEATHLVTKPDNQDHAALAKWLAAQCLTKMSTSPNQLVRLVTLNQRFYFPDWIPYHSVWWDQARQTNVQYSRIVEKDAANLAQFIQGYAAFTCVIVDKTTKVVLMVPLSQERPSLHKLWLVSLSLTNLASTLNSDLATLLQQTYFAATYLAKWQYEAQFCMYCDHPNYKPTLSVVIPNVQTPAQ